MSGYRDNLGAALVRVAQLEEEVQNLRDQLQQTPALQARLAELRGRRSTALESVRLVERGTRKALTVGLALASLASFAFVGTIASLGRAGHPMNAAVLCVVLTLPVLGLIALAGRARRSERVRQVDAVDREIAEVLETSGQRRVAPAIRVEALPEGHAEEVGVDDHAQEAVRRESS